MPFPLIPLIISAASAIGQHILQRRAAKKESQYNLRAQQQLNTQSYQQNLSMYREQNRYNSPASQMQRFSEAGLNPNLIYGQGSSGNAGPPPQLQAATSARRFDPLQIPDMINQYQTFQSRQADIAKSRSQTELLNQKTRTEAVNRMNGLLKGERGRFDLDLSKELRKYNVDIKGHESTQAGIKANMMAKEFALLDQFGTAERKSRLLSQSLSQARTAVGTQSEQERLALMKQFGWTKGYQESAARESNIMSAQQQAIFDKLKTTLFREHQMTPSDNFLVRMLMHFMMDNGMTPEDLGTFPPR